VVPEEGTGCSCATASPVGCQHYGGGNANLTVNLKDRAAYVRMARDGVTGGRTHQITKPDAPNPIPNLSTRPQAVRHCLANSPRHRR
jgi:hypothetical protein